MHPRAVEGQGARIYPHLVQLQQLSDGDEALSFRTTLQRLFEPVGYFILGTRQQIDILMQSTD
jgi:hypothetical protein